MVDRSDELLAKLAKEGDLRAFEELFGRYKKAVLNFIYRMIGNKETAEEVSLEVFMKVYSNLAIYDPSRKFSTWLYTIARNLTKNSLRDRKYFKDISLEEPISEDGDQITLKDVISDPNTRPDTVVQSNELNEEAQRVMEKLPAEYREVIALCSMQGLKQEEAARILGCSIATVSIRLEKAKELFMKRLGLGHG